jgi:hypothetical protein
VSQTKAQLLEGKTDQDVNAKTIALAGATSGTATISATAIAGTPTLTLPSVSGTIDRLNRAGNILQVVNSVYTSGTVSSSSSTYADTGISASITPSLSSSKILIFVNVIGCYKGTNNTYLRLKLLRQSTDLIEFENLGGYTATATDNAIGSCSANYLDSPATTASTTYKVQFASGANNAAAIINGSPGGGVTTSSTITLMEVAA